MAGGPSRWLLIGNSRWHWAEQAADGLRVWHSAPPRGPMPPAGDPADWPVAWAATGALPADLGLPAARRLELNSVPLAAAPPWLGVDRALAGWEAWRRYGAPVLVADAGTVLSLTRVDGDGRFAGGRLLAGLALQLRAMASGTAALPALALPVPAPGPQRSDLGADWPAETGAAMLAGVRRGLAAAVVQAALEVLAAEPAVRLVLTGGDGGALLEPVAADLGRHGQGVPLALEQNLCLEALVRLAPPPGGGLS